MTEMTEAESSTTPSLAFRTDDMKNAVFSLRVLYDHLAKVLNEPLYWKWALLALHDALQGFMVANLADSSKLSIMKDARACPHCDREVTKMICPGCSNEIEVFKEKRSWGTRFEWCEYYTSLRHGHGVKRKLPKSARLINFMEMFGRIQDDNYMKRLYGSKKLGRPVGKCGGWRSKSAAPVA